MVTENTAPNAAADVEMSQYVADRTRVNEDKIKRMTRSSASSAITATAGMIPTLPAKPQNEA